MLIIITEVWRSNNPANNKLNGKLSVPVSEMTSTSGLGSTRKLVCKNNIFLYFIFQEIILVVCSIKCINRQTDWKVLSFNKTYYFQNITFCIQGYNESYQKNVKFNLVFFYIHHQIETVASMHFFVEGKNHTIILRKSSIVNDSSQRLRKRNLFWHFAIKWKGHIVKCRSLPWEGGVTPSCQLTSGYFEWLYLFFFIFKFRCFSVLFATDKNIQQVLQSAFVNICKNKYINK